MSALPSTLHAVHAHFEPMSDARLDAVLAIEQSAYSHPWSRRNFSDSIAAGYQLQCLVAGAELLGYFVAMAGYREVHLLNITVAPAHQRQGWARVMLDVAEADLVKAFEALYSTLDDYTLADLVAQPQSLQAILIRQT